MSRVLRHLCWIALCQVVTTGLAHAEGEQLMPGGASAIGRGGATAARPSDVGTMLQNPAGLVDLQDNQGYLDFDISYNSICEHPYGYYGWGVYLAQDQAGNPNNPDDRRSEFGDPASSAYGNRHLDTICNSAPILPIPQIAFAFHLNERLSVALGFVAPAIVPGTQWGGADGTIQTNSGERPSPTRYQAIRQDVLFGLNPAAAVAYRVLPWLSLGVTLQATMANVNTYQAIALRAGTSPANDMMARLHVKDYFIPALIFGAYAKPTRRLRFGGTFNWSDGVNGSGDLTFATNYYHQGGVGSELIPLENDPVKLKSVKVAMPWTATLAARYVQPRDGASDERDLLKSEIWDVELDASYTANREESANSVQIAQSFELEFRRADGTPQMPLEVKQSDLKSLNVDRHLLDVLALRVGGGYNVIPGTLQVSAGGFFQTRGVDASYASVDNFGFMRIGLGLGVLYRIGAVDLMASYTHIFQETLDIAPPPNQPRTAATDDPTSGFDERVYQNGQLSAQPKIDPRAPSPAKADAVAKLQQSAVFDSADLRARVINAGRYTASFNVLSVGVVHHF